jgi:hypothetical protein
LSSLGQELAGQALKRGVFDLARLREAVSTIFYGRALQAYYITSGVPYVIAL